MQYKSQYVTMTKVRRYDYYYHMDIKLVHFLFAKITCKNVSCWEVTTKNLLYLIVPYCPEQAPMGARSSSAKN